MLLGIAQEDIDFLRWRPYVNDVLNCLHIDYTDNNIRGSHWVHLPSAGGYYDQDESIMELWEIIRSKIIQKTRERLSDAKNRNDD